MHYQVQITGERIVYLALFNFLSVYYPSIDSNKNEVYTGNKIVYSKGMICSLFFKLPLVQETNLLLYMFDHFITFFNISKYKFHIKYNKSNKSINYLDTLHLVKYPVKLPVKIIL